MTFPFSADQVEVFVLVLARTSAWLAAVPLLGSSMFNSTVKVGFAVTLALALTAPAGHYAHAIPSDFAGFATAVFVQAITGLALGTITGFLFHAAEVAGSLADMTSGLAFNAILDPTSGNVGSVFNRLFNMTFLAFVFLSDAHHELLTGFAHSFVAVPLGSAPLLSAGSIEGIANSVTLLLQAALEIGAPLLGVLFLTDVVLGLAGRFVPQANVLSVGLPAKAMIAMASAGAALTLLPSRIGPIVDAATSAAEVLWR